jgi:hypothetical protein
MDHPDSGKSPGHKRNVNLEAVRPLQFGRNPTTIFEFLVQVCTAAYADGYRKGVQAIDPRGTPSFTPYSPPEFNPLINGLSETAMAYLPEAQRDAAMANHVFRFEEKRLLIIERCVEETSSLWPAIIKILSPASISAVKSFDIERFEQAEINQDTNWLVSAIIGSHAATTTAGMSTFECNTMLDQRNVQYLTRTKGNLSMNEYLKLVTGDIKAIRSMDPSISRKGEGGALGTIQQQVDRFLRGTGATTIIGLHMNNLLGKENIPHSIEEVCTLYQNWIGSLTNDDRKVSASIMMMQSDTHDDGDGDYDHHEDSHMVAYSAKPKPGSKVESSSDDKKNKAGQLQKIATECTASLAKGFIPVDKSKFTGNVGQKRIVSPRLPERPAGCTGRACPNCQLGFHPDQFGNSNWYECGRQWNPKSLERQANHIARQAARNASQRPPAEKQATVALAQVHGSEASGAQGPVSAAEYATIVASRQAALTVPQTIAINHSQARDPRDVPTVEDQGWVQGFHQPYAYIGTFTATPASGQDTTLPPITNRPPHKRRISVYQITIKPKIKRKHSGVQGVVYKPLPRNSSHRDPSHPFDPRTSTLPAWMLDSGAGTLLLNNPYGLTDIYSLDDPVIISGITGASITVKHAGVLDGIEALYSADVAASCFPCSKLVDAGWDVEYMKRIDSYIVTSPTGRRLNFSRHMTAGKRITAHYISHPSLPYDGPALPARAARVLATSVAGNMAMHTDKDAKAATVAQRYLTNLGGSLAHGIIRLPLYRGVDISANAVRNAGKIFGPVISHAQGSSMSVQDVAVTTTLPSERPKPVPQSLAVDLAKILNKWFVLGVFLPCHYLVDVEVDDHTAEAILAAVKTMVRAAARRNFDVLQLQSDGEKGIHSPTMDKYCADNKIKLLKVGAGQHEAQIERANRAIKAEVRNIASRILPSHLTEKLATQLVHAATLNVNCRLTTALTGTLSPHQLWTGDEQLHAADIDFGFGDLALAKTPNNHNDSTPRADTVMVLSPVYNGLHGYLVYKLGSGQVVTRNHNTLRHVPWTTANVESINSCGRDDVNGVKLPRKEDGVDTGATADATATTGEAWITEHPNVGTRVAKMIRGKKYYAVIDKVLLPHTDDDGDYNEIVHHAVFDDDDEEDLVGDDEFEHAKSLASGTSRHAIIHRISVTQAMKDQPVETAAAMRHELTQMLVLGVFTPVMWDTLTPAQRSAVIRSSLFIKLKYKPSGDFDKCKARLVAGGNTQDKSLYTSISSPTATPTATLFVGGDAAKYSKSVASMDIGAAYLNADMAPTGVTVHMIIEPRLAKILVDIDPSYAAFLRHDGSVCVTLVKALYGTVEAAKLWYDLITKYLGEYGFVKNRYERCVLNKLLPDGTRITVVLYVDDLLVTCALPGPINDLRKHLESIFPEVSFHTGTKIDYVGMTLDFESQPGAMVVTMKHTTQDIITTCNVTKLYASPAAADLFDVAEDSPKLDPNQEAFFRTFVAKCLYIAKRGRPDLLLAIGFLTTRAKRCTAQDLTKLHRVLGYLRATPDRGIAIEFGDDPRVHSYIDASYAIHQRDGKSHTGAALMFGKGPLYVTSVKQAIVAKSSTEAELIAFSDVASEVVCLRNFSIDQGYSSAPAVVYQDNNSTMSLVDNGGPCSKRSRHIDIRHFWMAEKIADKSMTVVRCPTTIMWANVLTKPTQGVQFVTEVTGLTNWSPPQ